MDVPSWRRWGNWVHTRFNVLNSYFVLNIPLVFCGCFILIMELSVSLTGSVSLLNLWFLPSFTTPLLVFAAGLIFGLELNCYDT